LFTEVVMEVFLFESSWNCMADDSYFCSNERK